jgi:prepilin-type processing-associated H-X9-DG protein
MLVVIVIIGILAALIMPALGRTRESARSARCKNNLKNLHTAAMNYAYENNKALPPSTTWCTGFTSPTYWWGPMAYTNIPRGALWNFTGQNRKVYLCPTFARPEYCGARGPNPAMPSSGGALGSAANPVVRSYGMNSQLGNAQVGSREASRIFLFADQSHTNRYGGLQISQWSMRSYDPASPANNETYWNGAMDAFTNSSFVSREVFGVHHGGKANVIFLDGHVETLPPGDTLRAWKGKW